MDKEFIAELKKEGINLIFLFVMGLIIFKILFYKEAFITILRTVAAFFWIFVLPGFSLMYYWHEKIGFIERFVIGIAVSAAVIGITSYYVGLFGLHIKYHGFLLPFICLVTAVFIIFRKTRL